MCPSKKLSAHKSMKDIGYILDGRFLVQLNQWWYVEREPSKRDPANDRWLKICRAKFILIWGVALYTKEFNQLPSTYPLNAACFDYAE